MLSMEAAAMFRREALATAVERGDLEVLLTAVEDVLGEQPYSPETRATLVALHDARAWQAAHRAVEAACDGRRASGLGWEEV